MLVALALALVVVAGCGRADRTSGAARPYAADSRAQPAPGATTTAVTVPSPASATTVPPAAPTDSGAAAVDLAPVDELLAGVDRALADAEAGSEDDPSR
jgi:hypothetical protein